MAPAIPPRMERRSHHFWGLFASGTSFDTFLNSSTVIREDLNSLKSFAGFLGGWVDALISRITDAFLACPFLILAIALAAFLGPSLSNAMIAIGVSAMPSMHNATALLFVLMCPWTSVIVKRLLGRVPHPPCPLSARRWS